MRTKWMLWMLAVAMFLSTVCMTVVASAGDGVDELNIAVGSITLSEVNGNTIYSQSGEGLVIYTGSITITGTSTTNTITVESGTHDIILSNVNIDVSGTSNAAFDIKGTATANITLVGVNTLISGANCAGLQVPSGATVTIDGDGELNATGGEKGAGIGGGCYGEGGTIIISGGTVTATGGEMGAGIGSGYYGSAQGSSGGTITISGGTVTATGGGNGAGIGGGENGSAGTFSTNATDGTSGNAFIDASSISDNDDTSSWSGVIFQGTTGAVYGTSITLETDATIENGNELTIDDGQTLTIADGVTLTNNGTIINNGTIDNTNGTITNNSIYIDPLVNAKTKAEEATYSDTTQAEYADATAVSGYVKGIATDAIANSDIGVEIKTVTYTAPIAGTSATPSGTNGTFTFTVTVSKGEQSLTTDEITVTITATAYTGTSDEEAVATAKTSAENATYATTTQATNADETAIIDYINNLATVAVDNSEVAVAVNAVSYTAPVTGTSETPNGTDGAFTFTITVSKGEQSLTTDEITVTIMATAYTGTSDEEAVATAKTNAENATYATTTQATNADETAISDYINNLAAVAVSNSEVTVAVNKVSYTAPVAGTFETPNGTDGAFTFTITVSKGDQTQTTEQITVTITATAYVATSYPASVTYGTSNGTFTVGNGGEIVFTIDGDFEKFVDLYRNGVKLIKNSDYLAKSGSVIITLPAAYVNSLSVGTHTFTAVMTDGNATITLLAVEEVTYPQTGDSTFLLWYVLLASLGLCGLGTLLFARKKVQK